MPQKHVVNKKGKSNNIAGQLLKQLGVLIVSKLIPLASIFIYSRYMSVSDYGVLNLIQSYLWIFVLLLSFNLHVSVGRYIYEPKAKEGQFLASTIAAVGTIFIIGLIIVWIESDRLAEWLDLPSFVIILLLAPVLGMICESLFTQLAIHDQRGGLLFIVIASKSLLSLAGSVILLFMLTDNKYVAILVAESLASLGLCSFVAYLLRGRIVWKPRSQDILYMAKYALPLIPYMLALTLLSQFDRVLINRYYGKEIIGYYSIGYNVGALLMMAVGAALNALTPGFFAALNRGNLEKIKQETAVVFNFAIIATCAMVLFGPDIATLLLPSKYYDGFYLIPIVALGGLCSVIFQCWVRILAFEHRTFLISFIALLGTTLNIGLNLWLLPITNYKTGAFTTLVAYLFMSTACVIAVNRFSGLHIAMWRELKWIALIAMWLPFLHLPPTPMHLLIKAVLLLSCVWVLRSSIRTFMPWGSP
jgi:O-antigen/teichoic acid export membrane protein